MTSQERREARYQRRRAKRQAKKQGRSHSLGGLEKTFTYRKMFQWGWKCCKGVNWKQSVQNFRLHLFSGTARRRRAVISGRWKPGKCVHFTLRERGKVRPIDAPHIVDRQVHKVLCNEVLIPLYKPGMIYDNGASQRMKGLHWAYRRLSDYQTVPLLRGPLYPDRERGRQKEWLPRWDEAEPPEAEIFPAGGCRRAAHHC